MKKGVKLYSIYFPFYAFIMLDYVFFLPMLPINFAVTALLLFIVLRASKVENWKQVLKQSIWRVFGFGLLADLVGVLFRFLPLLTEKLCRLIGLDVAADYLCKYWSDVVLYNIYLGDVPKNLTWTVISILIAGIFVFIFNYYLALPKVMEDVKLRKRMAIVMAILTAPYSFMNPFW